MFSVLVCASIFTTEIRDYSICVDGPNVYGFAWKQKSIDQIAPIQKTIAVPFKLSRKCQLRTIGTTQYLLSSTTNVIHCRSGKGNWKQVVLKGIPSLSVSFNGRLYTSTFEPTEKGLTSYIYRVYEVSGSRITNQWQVMSGLARGEVPVFIGMQGDLYRINSEGKTVMVRSRNSSVMKALKSDWLLAMAASTDYVLMNNMGKCTYVSLRENKDVPSNVGRVTYAGCEAYRDQIWAYGERGNEMLVERWAGGNRTTLKIDANSRTFCDLFVDKSQAALILRERGEEELRLKFLTITKGKIQDKTLFKSTGSTVHSNTVLLNKTLYMWSREKGKQVYKFQ